MAIPFLVHLIVTGVESILFNIIIRKLINLYTVGKDLLNTKAADWPLNDVQQLSDQSPKRDIILTWADFSTDWKWDCE